jgi:hypothetical protein
MRVLTKFRYEGKRRITLEFGEDDDDDDERTSGRQYGGEALRRLPKESSGVRDSAIQRKISLLEERFSSPTPTRALRAHQLLIIHVSQLMRLKDS